MAQITEKELTALSDLLGMEEGMVAKYRAYACTCTHDALKNTYEQMAQRHQRRYDVLYTSLK